MKRLILTAMLILGGASTSFNSGGEVELRPPVVMEITASLENLKVSLDSLNSILDGTVE